MSLIPSNNLQKAYGEVKEQIGLITQKGVAQAKIAVAHGLRSIAYPFSGKINKTLVLVAQDLKRQAEQTHDKIPSTSLLTHVKKLGKEVIRDLQIKYAKIILLFKKPQPKLPHPPPDVSPRYARKAIAIMDAHILETSAGKYRLSEEEKSVLTREFMRCVNKDLSVSELRVWIDETFAPKDQRSSIIHTCLEHLQDLVDSLERYPMPQSMLPPQVDSLEGSPILEHMDSLPSEMKKALATSALRETYGSIRKQKPKIADLHFQALKDGVDRLDIKPEQKTFLKAVFISALLQESAADWKPQHPSKSRLNLLTFENHRSLERDLKEKYKDFMGIYEQFVSLDLPVNEKVAYNNKRNQELRELVRELPSDVTDHSIIRELLLQ